MKVTCYYIGIKKVEKEIPDKFKEIPEIFFNCGYFPTEEESKLLDEYGYYSEAMWAEIEASEYHPEENGQNFFCGRSGVYRAEDGAMLEEY